MTTTTPPLTALNAFPLVNGWSDPGTPEQVRYVDPVGGNDALAGSSPSTAVRSVTPIYNAMPDGRRWDILFKGGTRLTEQIPYIGKSGIRFGSYGGSRAIVVGPAHDSAFTCANSSRTLDYLALTDLDFVTASDGNQAEAVYGAGIRGSIRHLLVEGCRFTGFSCNVDIEDAAFVTNAVLRRNVVRRAWHSSLAMRAQGTYIGGGNSILDEENVYDCNGWDGVNAIDNTQRHNQYFHQEVRGATCRGNLSARACSDGIQFRGGGYLGNNCSLFHPMHNILGTGAGICAAVGNVMLDSRNLYGTGGTSGDRGHGVNIAGGVGYYVSSNLCAGRSVPGQYNIMAYSVDKNDQSQYAAGVHMAGNYSYGWQDAAGHGAAYWQNSGCPVPAFYGGNFLPDGIEHGHAPAGALTIPSLAAALGLPPTLVGLMAAACEQSRFNWRDDLTGTALCPRVRASYGMPASIA